MVRGSGGWWLGGDGNKWGNGVKALFELIEMSMFDVIEAGGNCLAEREGVWGGAGDKWEQMLIDECNHEPWEFFDRDWHCIIEKTCSLSDEWIRK